MLDFFGPTAAMTFSFTGPLMAFGIDINTFADTDGAYTLTTSAAEVVDSFFDPFPGASTGQFVGFSSTLAFSSVTIAPTTGFSYTFDTLRAVAAVPEPGILSLLAVTFFALAFTRKRRGQD